MTLLHFAQMGREVEIQVWKNKKMIYKGERYGFPDSLNKENVHKWRVENKEVIVILRN